jgi:hypothetical protein
MIRMHALTRIFPLFLNDDQIPKLDVAGSTPVSRSIFSITYSRFEAESEFQTRLEAPVPGKNPLKIRKIVNPNASVTGRHS